MIIYFPEDPFNDNEKCVPNAVFALGKTLGSKSLFTNFIIGINPIYGGLIPPDRQGIVS